jgi:hypothetical protein
MGRKSYKKAPMPFNEHLKQQIIISFAAKTETRISSELKETNEADLVDLAQDDDPVAVNVDSVVFADSARRHSGSDYFAELQRFGQYTQITS